MKSLVLIPVAAVLVTAAGASVAARAGLPFKQLIVQAIDSPVGTARETFGADVQWVKLFRQKLGTDGPITVSTRVVQRWKQEGCARIETEFLFHRARFDDSKREFKDESFAMQVNSCRDGQPPIEAMDLRSLKDTMSSDPEPAQSQVRRLTMPPRDTAPAPTVPPIKK
jgi:hypothetical protein